MSVRLPCFRVAAAFAALVLSSPALAELPPPVRAMIDAAIATGDPQKVATVVELARQTNPEDVGEIDTLAQAFDARLAERAEAAAAEKQQAIRSAGLFEQWTGKGELGASYSSGNSDSAGLSLALLLEREGIDWTHKLRARADYQRANGTTSREQLLASYEPRYQLGDDLFAYGLAQYERDPFQGLAARYSVSSGLGYRVIDGERLELAVKAGPAYRRSAFVGGGSDESLAALVGLDFDWRISDALSLTHDANAVAEGGGQATAFIGGGNTSISLVTGLDARISDRVGARLSYAVDYDSNPPAGAVATDTLSRVTVVYDF